MTDSGARIDDGSPIGSDTLPAAIMIMCTLMLRHSRHRSRFLTTRLTFFAA